MSGIYGVSIAPGSEILSGLPIPTVSSFFPVYNYLTQEVIGLVQITSSGKLVAYSGNTKNLNNAVYGFSYLAE